MTRLLSVLFFCFLFASSYSQEVWTLEKCITYAIENNIQLKQQELSTKYSKNSYLQSKMGILPNLNANGNQNYSFGRSVDPYSNDFVDENVKSNNFSISSSITLFQGFQALNTIRQNYFNLNAALQDVEKAKNDIALNIAAAYLQILYNQALVEIASKQLSITQQQSERTKKLVEAGSLAIGNKLEVEAQVASEELQLVNYENQLSLSYLTLKQILDLDSVSDFKIASPEIADPDSNFRFTGVQSIYDESVTNLPQIKSAELKVKGNEMALLAAIGRRSPRITLSGSYGTGYSDARMRGSYVPSTVLIGQTASGESVYGSSFTYNTENYPFNDQIKDNASTSLSIGVIIPIFNGWQTNASISNSKISLLNSKYNLQIAEKQLFKEIQQAHSDAVAAMRKFVATKKLVKSNEEAFRYTQQKFDVGLVNSVDYNLAKNKLIKAESDLLQAKYEFVFKLKILDFYRGNQIKL